MSSIVVNCRKVPFASTLGVAHFLLRVCEQLSDDHEMTFVVPDLAEFEASNAAGAVRSMAHDVVTPDDPVLRSPTVRARTVELLPHHFQGPDFCDHSLVVCHDLHVFDIPWKYGDRSEAMQRTFRQVLTRASAVMTHFPRTYFDVERVAAITLPNLFLTPSPLLLDTSSQFGISPHNDVYTLMYPAQLQAHKNHPQLIESISRVSETGREIRLLLPGSDFDAEISESVRQLVETVGMTQHVQFLGRVPDEELIELYGRVDAVVVPSAAEGGAYVALEAIAAGRPVAVNGIVSARRHLESMSGRAVWFDVSRPDSLDQAILTLMESGDEVAGSSNDACRAAVAATTWGDVADVVRSILAMLRGRASRPRLRTDSLASTIEYA